MQKLFKRSSNLVFSQAKKSLALQHRGFTSYLIKNGTVVNADQQFKADVVIQDDKI
jgi:dihydropyrimidinase